MTKNSKKLQGIEVKIRTAHAISGLKISDHTIAEILKRYGMAPR